MKKFNQAMKDALHFIGRLLAILWQLPQTLVGIAASVSTKAKVGHLSGIRFWQTDRFRGAVTLGEVIIVGSVGMDGLMLTVRHEYGHVRQSRILGPLYLPTVCLWSGVRAWLNLYRRGRYYATWTERWADRLGGVTRDTDGNRTYVPKP